MTVDGCQLSVVGCQLSVVGCQLQRTTDHGPRTTDHGPRTTDHGPRTTDHGPRTTHIRSVISHTMKKNKPKSKLSDKPRKQAKALLSYQAEDMSVEKVRDLIDELQTQQAKLEMQNEALRRTQLELEASREALQRRLAMEEVVGTISTLFINVTPAEADHEINNALEAVGKLVGADSCYILLFSENGTLIDRLYEWRSEGVESQEEIRGLSPGSFRWSMEKLRQLRIIHVPKVAGLPSEAGNEKKLCRMLGIQSVVAVPIVLSRVAVGFLGFSSVHTEKKWSEEDLTLLRPLGETFANVLERKRAEEALQRSENKYHLLFEKAPVGIVMTDTRGKIIDCNQVMEKISGYSLKEFQTINIADTYVDSGDHRKLLKILRTSGNMRNREVRLRRKDGTAYYALINSDMAEIEGNDVILITVRDITEMKQAQKALRESEERFRAQYMGIPIPTYTWQRQDDDFVMIDCNIAAESFAGGDAKTFIGQKLSVFFQDSPDLIAYVSMCYEKKKTIRKQVHRRLHFTRERKHLHLTHVFVPPDLVMIHIDDITESKEVQAAWRRFEFIANSSKDFMTLINKNYVYEAANRSYRKYFNKTKEEIVGKTVAAVWGEEVFEEHIRPRIDKCLAGEEGHFKGWIEFHNKGRGYYDVSYYPYFNDEGEVTHVAVFSLDNTEGKQAEDAFRESEEKFLLFMDHIPGCAFIKDENLDLIYVNKYMQDTFREKEWTGQSPQELFPKELSDIFTRKDKKTLTEGIQEITEIVSDRHGVPYIYKTLKFPIFREEKPTLIGGISIDTTKQAEAEKGLRESEAKFRALAETTSSGIFIYKGDRHIYVNPAFETITGYGKEELALMSCRDLAHPDMKNIINLRYMAKQQGKNAPHSYEIKFRTKKGETRWVDFTITPIKYEGQRAFLGTAFDITNRVSGQEELKQAYEKLKSTQGQLIQSAKLASIGELVAGVTHELNQPLMIIRGNVQLLLRGFEKRMPGREELLEDFEIIERNTTRMMNIINHMRTFSRQSQSDFRLTDMNGVVEDAFLMIGQQLWVHSIKAEKDLSRNLPKVHGDANQLEQVFLNLIANARDAVEEKRGQTAGHLDSSTEKVGIITRVGKDDKTVLEILVRDTGAGIPSENRDKIFDPFFTTKEVGKGTGLGLSIAYGIIKDHGGLIEIAETGPGGTTFRVRLPAATV
ncbi:PAS domain S-box protein [Desulfobacterales bacterium HSG2]|nr:PAS domain S-box protein [Desulfobacterales bacterium HSG2]